MTSLVVEGIVKRFGEARVLCEVSLAADEGEILVLLGPSGSGKTTLLRVVAGFETPEAGRVEIGGADVTRLPPARRNVGMVFQHFALFPHLTVEGNVAFGLAGRGLDEAARRHRVEAMLELVELPGFAARRIDQLSGGQQQRVALARALAPQPRLLLLDEPLSNLDPALRERTRRLLAAAVRRVGITALWVTHEQAEAFSVGDRVAVLEAGRLAQVAAPRELYAAPADRFVAGFVGRANWLPARLDGGGGAVLAGAPLPGSARVVPVAGAGAGEVDIRARPEQLALAAQGPGGFAGTVAECRFAGERTYVSVVLDGGGEVEVSLPGGEAAAGDRVAVRLRPEAGPFRAYPKAGESAAADAAPAGREETPA